MNADLQKYVGKHQAIITEAQFGEAGTGTEQCGMGFRLPDGFEIAGYLFFSEAAFERSVAALAEAGVDPAAPEFDWNPAKMEAALPNKEIQITIGWETHEGETRLRVKFIGTGTGGGLVKERFDEAKSNAFQAKMRAKWAAKAGGGAQTAQAASAATGSAAPY